MWLATMLLPVQFPAVTSSETTRKELNAMNAAIEAEGSALQFRVFPTKLLILHIGDWLLREDVRLNANLLVISETVEGVE